MCLHQARSGLSLPIWTVGLSSLPLAGGMHEFLRYRAGLHPYGRLRGPGESPVLGARSPEEPLAFRQLQRDGGWLPPLLTPAHVTPVLAQTPLPSISGFLGTPLLSLALP